MTGIPGCPHCEPLRAPETDEEPWTPEPVDPRRFDALDAASTLTTAWMTAVTFAAVSLAALLAVLAIRRSR